jgi:hypothetical protein
MRWLALIALAAFFSEGQSPAQTSQDSSAPAQPTITHLAKPTAEPENSGAYASPAPGEKEGPSKSDIGPVQKHFVLASQTDNLAETQVDDNKSLLLKEKTTLDKRISVKLIHDVQNDSTFRAGENHALDYERDYLNWGAVTNEQLQARQGHYFTITWKNDGPRSDFIARFEYRQVKSKEIVRTLIQPMPKVSGATRSYFAVVNQAYLAYGPVYSWRFTILRGDTVVAESKSFIW